MDLKDIKAIIDLMRKNSISEFELEKPDFKVKLKRGGNGNPAGLPYDETGALPMIQAQPVLPQGTALTPPPALPPSNEIEIKSPMIGTFYRSPSPDSAPYAEVGTEVGPDTVVCIIEAMKVMNEIKSEVKGVVTQIMLDNAKPVEFGQPLFKVRPA